MGLFSKGEREMVEILGKAPRCQVCGNGTFWKRRAHMPVSPGVIA